MTEFVQSLASLDLLWIYVVIFLVAYIENIFPPSPGDVVVVFGGAVAAIGGGNFFIVLFAGTIGSTLGFMTMYVIGKWFGDEIVEKGKLRFFPLGAIKKIELWFQRYGYWLIAANRFLAGTRAVVSFFAGLSELNLPKTSILSFVSALTWYSVLVYAGYSLGKNWDRVGWYLSTYSQIVTAVLIAVAVILVVRYFYKKNTSVNSNG